MDEKRLSVLRMVHGRKVEAYHVAEGVHTEAARLEIVTAGRKRKAFAAMMRSGRELDRLEKAVL